MNSDFCVFILTHARAEKVITYSLLRDRGYTGEIFLVIDDTDKQADLYKEKYGDNVLVFNKDEIAKEFDEGDNFKDRRAVVYARNAVFELARQVGFKYFMVLDDDYTDFRWTFDNDKNYKITKNYKLDRTFQIMLNFYKSVPVTSIAMSQGGDFIGGEGSGMSKLHIAGQIHRKVMNTFICSTDRPFQFIGRINEDVNAYINLGNKGELFFTIARLRVEQKQTQANTGGLTEIYLSMGTYVKSFYSVMYNPSCVKVRMMGETRRRLHHSVTWENAVPKILNEKFKKYADKDQVKTL